MTTPTPTTVQVKIQLRRDTAATWASVNPVLLAGEAGLETDTNKIKIGNGSTAWNSLGYFPFVVNGGTVTGNLEIGTTGTLTFEGSSADNFETTLGVINPTADRTINLPNVSGTIITTGDTGTVTSTMIADGTIVDADVSATAEIAVSKLANGAARQLLQTDAAGTGVEWTSNVDIPGTLDVTGTATFDGAVTVAGDLTVNGTTTNINTQNLVVEDKNIILGDVATPTDVTADGGGITLKGTTDKTINWVDATDAWTSSERFSVPLGSAASPSLTFTGDPNTGIYSPGADQVAISTGGSGRLFVDASGNVGINRSAPQAYVGYKTLEIEDTTGAVIRLRNTSGFATFEMAANASEVYLSNTQASPLTFKTNNTERLRITSAGLVGVGTSAPSGTLHLKHATDANIFFRNGTSAGLSTGTILECFNDATNATTPLYARASQFQFGTDSGGTFVPRMTVDSSGRLGVGTTSPATQLHLAGSADIRLTNTANTSGFDIGLLGGSSDPIAYVYNRANSHLVFGTNNSERLRVTSAGLVGIGTSTPGSLLHLSAASGTVQIEFNNGGTSSYLGHDPSVPGFDIASKDVTTFRNFNGALFVETMRITPAGRVGIGTTSASAKLSVSNGGAEGIEFFPATTAGVDEIQAYNRSGASYDALRFSAAQYQFYVGASQRAAIDTSGRLLVGTSSSATAGNSQYCYTQVVGGSGGSAWGGISLRRNETASSITTDEPLGITVFADSTGNEFGYIGCFADANAGANDYPGRLVFSTTADGASSPTERMRITSAGTLLLGKTVTDVGVIGVEIGSAGGGYVSVGRSGDIPLFVNRTTNDGILVNFAQDSVQEGTISVSGTTVSYNGAHLSRWSQLPSGAERVEILRGTVLSNIDEMCEWNEEENEQLNRMKVSDVEGDKNVSGVFQAWDDDDDTYTNDFYCAMTGDFIIRIGAGVTVERGDLLMSAGDGTAKPQDDDIIRSKTVAKVTSTNVSCTYEDGSYCVPCVLMAC